jgi:hypothetical protein
MLPSCCFSCIRRFSWSFCSAVAGQAGVPFFHASGSEFDEVLVGQGARRVRDLFKAAKARAPCVIFIGNASSKGVVVHHGLIIYKDDNAHE